jgi:hypothetical protein
MIKIKAVLFTLLFCAASVHAEPPAIEYALADINEYEVCLNSALAQGRWKNGTEHECRRASPAVDGFVSGYYNGASFSAEQIPFYDPAFNAFQRVRVDIARRVSNEIIPNDIKSVKNSSAYSFKLAQENLSEKYAEIIGASSRFTYESFDVSALLSAEGFTLEQLYNFELSKFSDCISSAPVIVKASGAEQALNHHIDKCYKEITEKNSDLSVEIYRASTFNDLVSQRFNNFEEEVEVIAGIEEADKYIEKQQSLSFWGKYKSVIGLVFGVVALVVAAGIRGGSSAQGSSGSTRTNSSSEKRGSSVSARTESRSKATAYSDNEETLITNPAKPDHNELSRIQLGCFKVGGSLKQKNCANCKYWLGEVKYVPKLNGYYVERNSRGDCGFKRNGSQFKNVIATNGMHCKEFSSR